MKKIIMMSCLLVALCSLGGCATVAGFGEDVSYTGDVITGAAY